MSKHTADDVLTAARTLSARADMVQADVEYHEAEARDESVHRHYRMLALAKLPAERAELARLRREASRAYTLAVEMLEQEQAVRRAEIAGLELSIAFETPSPDA